MLLLLTLPSTFLALLKDILLSIMYIFLQRVDVSSLSYLHLSETGLLNFNCFFFFPNLYIFSSFIVYPWVCKNSILLQHTEVILITHTRSEGLPSPYKKDCFLSLFCFGVFFFKSTIENKENYITSKFPNVPFLFSVFTK